MPSVKRTKETFLDSIENLSWNLIIILLYNLLSIGIVIAVTFKQETDILSTITGVLFLVQTSILLFRRNKIGWYFMVIWALLLITKIQGFLFIKFGLDISIGFKIAGVIFAIDVLSLAILILTLVSKSEFD